MSSGKRYSEPAIFPSQKRVTRIAVRRDKDDNDVAVTYVIPKFQTLAEAGDHLGEGFATKILQDRVNLDARRHAIANADVFAKHIDDPVETRF